MRGSESVCVASGGVPVSEWLLERLSSVLGLCVIALVARGRWTLVTNAWAFQVYSHEQRRGVHACYVTPSSQFQSPQTELAE